MAHVPFGKPVSTFQGYALAPSNRPIRCDHRGGRRNGRVSNMDVAQRESNGQREARPNGEQSADTDCDLSIPSFASDRCRLVSTSLVRALASIPPTDDAAIEDRALACFVVACGELSLMQDLAHRDMVVEQLTIVARKLVKANVATYKPNLAQAPTARNQAQGLAEGLMRGLVRNAAATVAPAATKPPARKAPPSKPSSRPFFLDVTVDPPGFSTGDVYDEAQLDADVSGDAADAVAAESAPAESVDVVAVAITAAEGVSTEAASAEAKLAEAEPGEVAQANASRPESVANETGAANVAQREGAPTEIAGAAVTPAPDATAEKEPVETAFVPAEAETPSDPVHDVAVEAASVASGEAVADEAVDAAPAETGEIVYAESARAEPTAADQSEFIPSLTVDDVAVEVEPQPAEPLVVDIGSDAEAANTVHLAGAEAEAVSPAESAQAAKAEVEPAATETIQAGSAQTEIASAGSTRDDTRDDPAQPKAIELKTADAHAELSWDELESLIRQEVSELATHH
jgi:hypothetical protein